MKLTVRLFAISSDFLYTEWITFKQFNWSSLLPHSVAIPPSVPCVVVLDPPTEVEIHNEIPALVCYKASGSDGLSPALFEDGIVELIKGVGFR